LDYQYIQMFEYSKCLEVFAEEMKKDLLVLIFGKT